MLNTHSRNKQHDQQKWQKQYSQQDESISPLPRTEHLMNSNDVSDLRVDKPYNISQKDPHCCGHNLRQLDLLIALSRRQQCEPGEESWDGKVFLVPKPEVHTNDGS